MVVLVLACAILISRQLSSSHVHLYTHYIMMMICEQSVVFRCFFRLVTSLSIRIMFDLNRNTNRNGFYDMHLGNKNIIILN